MSQADAVQGRVGPAPAAAPAPAAKPASRVNAGLKRGLIRAGLGLSGVALCSTLALWSSGALFLAVNKTDPRKARPLSTVNYWFWYRGTALDKKLKASTLLGGMGCMFGLPLGIYMATRNRRQLHGDARFANRAEIKKAGLLPDPKAGEAEPGILVGEIGGQLLSLRGQRFVMLSAPTRSGKGVGVVIPNLLTWPHSVVVNDIKDECFQLTARYRQDVLKQRVYRWAPFDSEGRSCTYNPLVYIDAESPRLVSDVLALGLLFYPDDSTSGSDRFFNDQARNLFLGFVLYLLATPERPRTMGELLRQSSATGGGDLRTSLRQTLSDRQAGPNKLRDECIEAFSRFLAAPDNTSGSILSTFHAVLTMWADETVDAAMADNSFDLRDLRRKPTTVYLHVPANRRGTARLLINLFFSQLIEISTETTPDKDPSLKLQVLLMLDEFPSLGKVSAISNSIAYLAGYNLRLLTIAQSHSQLVEIYGEHMAQNFVANHGLQILYTPRELRDSEEYSKRLGTADFQTRSKSRSHSYGKSSSSSSGSNESVQARALMLPQEFRAMPFEKEVIDLEGVRPIDAEKIIYWKDERFAGRVQPPPVVPQLDLDMHRARLQARTRALDDIDDVRGTPLDAIDLNLHGLTLPKNPSPEEAASFCKAFYDRLAVAASPTEPLSVQPERQPPPRSELTLVT
jgi:type IV secretion system protein VirD4